MPQIYTLWNYLLSRTFHDLKGTHHLPEHSRNGFTNTLLRVCPCVMTYMLY